MLGVEVSSEPIEILMRKINTNIINGEKRRIIAINPEKIMMAQQKNQFKELLNSSDYQIPDGIGVSVASKILGGKIRWRITGIGMMEKLLSLANDNNYKVFFYGSKNSTLNLAMDNLKKQYPNLQIAGFINGYETDEHLILKKINESEANILFVALGSPKQELFIQNNMESLSPAIFQGIGGSVDVLSGGIKRAPAFFQRFGLEWLYRLINQPSRIKRQLALPKFLFKIIKEYKFKNK